MFPTNAKDISLNTQQNKNGQVPSFAQPRPVVLIVDSDPAWHGPKPLLSNRRYEVITALSAEEALQQLEKREIDLMLSDLELPSMSGIELIARARYTYPHMPVIAVAGRDDTPTAVKLFKLGASDFIIKPFSPEAIQQSVDSALEKAKPFIEMRHWRRSLAECREFAGIVSKAPGILRVHEIIRAVADSDATVVIEGETGTGKELVANAIHSQSGRRNGPFMVINCGGLPETLLESELFGYERGAFTGAAQAKAGKIELAEGGTLFLDELQNMSLTMQAKLLRVLQDRRVQRLGGTRWIRIDLRVIVASNVPLKDLLARGQLRNDFYYRINVVPISLIPLRLRREDIPLLSHHFLSKHPTAINRGIKGIRERALNKLMQYSWPGNIRELQNVLERAIVFAKGHFIENVELPDSVELPQVDAEIPSRTLPLREWMEVQEEQYILNQLAMCGGKVGAAAKSSGVDLKTLYRKMRAYGIDKKDFKIKLTGSDLALGTRQEPAPASSMRGDQNNQKKIVRLV